ncbi:MAG TPA: hypothetical protein VF483_11675 [Gemmatimonadaceae bacterium]
MRLNHALLGLLLVCAAAPAVAQDPFEIQVYEYELVPKGKYDLETHFNHTFKGDVATHLTWEFTRGWTDRFETAVYLLTSSRPGVTDEFAGWHVRPRFNLPESWLPFKFSLSTEIGFPQAPYETAKWTIELRPIFEWNWGKVQIDVNPTMGKGFGGPVPNGGWDLEPAVRLGLPDMGKWAWSLEYYGSYGELKNIAPYKQEVHQFYPGFDYNYNDKLVLNVGVGMAMTGAGNQLVGKTRLGWIFP